MHFKPLSATAAVLALFMAAPCAARSAPAVAIIADVQGRATLEGGGALRLLDEIPEGRKLRLGKGARLVLVDLATGDEITYTGPGSLSLSAGGVAAGLRPSDVRKHKALAGLKLRREGLAQVALVMRSGTAAPALDVRPRGPVVLDTAPEFRWEPLEGQAAYRFQLFDAKGAVLVDRTTTATILRIPDLDPREDFTWVLEGRVPSRAPRVATGTLRVADAATREAVAGARPGAGATFAARLMFAALLESAQLGDEAALAWKALDEERPGDPRLQRLAGR